jgi:hypothetical protein
MTDGVMGAQRAGADLRRISYVNGGEGDEVRFDLPTQTGQIDHAVPGSTPIDKVARGVGASVLTEVSEVGNDLDHDVIRRARLFGCLAIRFARQPSK